MSNTILVTSGKGGVGKTTLAVSIGALMALEGKRVAVVDMCDGARNADLYLGLESNVVYDMSDVVSGSVDPEAALIEDERTPGLFLLPAAADTCDDEGMAEGKSAVINGIKKSFDYVLVDMMTGSASLRRYMDIADMILLVTTPETASLRPSEGMIRELRSKGAPDVKVIINRLIPEYMNSGVVPKLRDIGEILGCDIDGIVQEDKLITYGNALGVPAVLKQDTYITSNINKITKIMM